MKSIITQNRYEHRYPGYISDKICLEYNLTNVFFFTSIELPVDYKFALSAEYTPLYHSHDYSKYSNKGKVNIPKNLLSDLECYRSFIYRHINRWHKNYSISSSLINYDVLYFNLVTHWYNFLINNNVVAFFMWMPHGVDDTIIYSLCNILKIKITNETDFFNFGLSRVIVTHGLSNFISFNWESVNLLDSDLDEFSLRFFADSEDKLSNVIQFESQIGSSINFYKYLFDRISYHLREKKYNVLFRKFLYILFLSFREKKILNYLNKNEMGANILDNLKFVYFPLHLQPEATTSLYGGSYENILFAIKSISPTLESDTYLVIKEHPAYWLKKKSEYFHGIFEYRSLEFYQSILRLDNTILVSHNVPTEYLIDKSVGVATITGTAALESFERGKSVLLFGDFFYKYLPNVVQYITESDIYSFNMSLSNVKKTFPRNQVYKLSKLLQLNSYKYNEKIEEVDRDDLINIYMKIYTQL